MVEKWLLQVQQTMILSLKDVMSNAVAAYNQDPRRKWVLEWPGQVIIAASTVFWTIDVSSAIENGTLKVYNILYGATCGQWLYNNYYIQNRNI